MRVGVDERAFQAKLTEDQELEAIQPESDRREREQPKLKIKLKMGGWDVGPKPGDTQLLSTLGLPKMEEDGEVAIKLEPVEVRNGETAFWLKYSTVD